MGRNAAFRTHAHRTGLGAGGYVSNLLRVAVFVNGQLEGPCPHGPRRVAPKAPCELRPVRARALQKNGFHSRTKPPRRVKGLEIVVAFGLFTSGTFRSPGLGLRALRLRPMGAWALQKEALRLRPMGAWALHGMWLVLFLSAFMLHAEPSTHSALQERARAEALHEDPTWRRLLHVEPGARASVGG